MLSREQERTDLAAKICSLPYSKLMEWGLTRTADLTGLDTIGLPVYSVCRPNGESITISAGKGVTKQESKAGAILEGVELWASEHPELQGAFGSHSQVSNLNVLDFDLFQLARDAPVDRNTRLCFDEMDDVFSGKKVLVPSDMIWMKARIKPPFQYFQSSSSGLAAGVNVADAVLQATYEVIERDGWAISELVQEHTGKWSERISLDCELANDMQYCVNRLQCANVTPFLFDLTQFGIPIFRCIVLDKEGGPGAFAGFGCSLDPSTAARRALLEACQARAAYIGGARDDLFRRKFLLMKNLQKDILFSLYDSLPKVRPLSDYGKCRFGSIEIEWECLCALLNRNKIDVLSKVLYTCQDPYFVIVKVICPQLECPIWEHHTMGKRAIEAIKCASSSI